MSSVTRTPSNKPPSRTASADPVLGTPPPTPPSFRKTRDAAIRKTKSLGQRTPEPTWTSPVIPEYIAGRQLRGTVTAVYIAPNVSQEPHAPLPDIRWVGTIQTHKLWGISHKFAEQFSILPSRWDRGYNCRSYYWFVHHGIAFEIMLEFLRYVQTYYIRLMPFPKMYPRQIALYPGWSLERYAAEYRLLQWLKLKDGWDFEAIRGKCEEHKIAGFLGMDEKRRAWAAKIRAVQQRLGYDLILERGARLHVAAVDLKNSSSNKRKIVHTRLSKMMPSLASVPVFGLITEPAPWVPALEQSKAVFAARATQQSKTINTTRGNSSGSQVDQQSIQEPRQQTVVYHPKPKRQHDITKIVNADSQNSLPRPKYEVSDSAAKSGRPLSQNQRSEGKAVIKHPSTSERTTQRMKIDAQESISFMKLVQQVKQLTAEMKEMKTGRFYGNMQRVQAKLSHTTKGGTPHARYDSKLPKTGSASSRCATNKRGATLMCNGVPGHGHHVHTGMQTESPMGILARLKCMDVATETEKRCVDVATQTDESSFWNAGLASGATSSASGISYQTSIHPLARGTGQKKDAWKKIPNKNPAAVPAKRTERGKVPKSERRRRQKQKELDAKKRQEAEERKGREPATRPQFHQAGSHFIKTSIPAHRDVYLRRLDQPSASVKPKEKTFFRPGVFGDETSRSSDGRSSPWDSSDDSVSGEEADQKAAPVATNRPSQPSRPGVSNRSSIRADREENCLKEAVKPVKTHRIINTDTAIEGTSMKPEDPSKALPPQQSIETNTKKPTPGASFLSIDPCPAGILGNVKPLQAPDMERADSKGVIVPPIVSGGEVPLFNSSSSVEEVLARTRGIMPRGVLVELAQVTLGKSTSTAISERVAVEEQALENPHKMDFDEVQANSILMSRCEELAAVADQLRSLISNSTKHDPNVGSPYADISTTREQLLKAIIDSGRHLSDSGRTSETKPRKDKKKKKKKKKNPDEAGSKAAAALPTMSDKEGTSSSATQRFSQDHLMTPEAWLLRNQISTVQMAGEEAEQNQKSEEEDDEERNNLDEFGIPRPFDAGQWKKEWDQAVAEGDGATILLLRSRVFWMS